MEYITGKEIMEYGVQFYDFIQRPEPLLLYGAGYICRQCLSLFAPDIKQKITAIAVTSMKNNVDCIDGIEVKSLDDCLNNRNANILITIKDKKVISDIRNILEEKGFQKILAADYEILCLYNRFAKMERCSQYLKHNFLNTPICAEEVYKKTLNLGMSFAKNFQNLQFRSLAMVWGGSKLLDYALLRGLVQKYKIQTYLEIGTYIGDSLTVVSDLVKHCYSISVPENHPAHMRYWCQGRHMNDYSNKLVNEKNMIQFQEDSRDFDFARIQENIGLYYIDGDHSYEGVFIDSIHVSSHFDPQNDFIVWHDCRTAAGVDMNVIHAIRDGIGEYFDNFYIFDNSMSGIYIPEKYRDDFCMASEEDELITYKVILSANIIKP